MTQILLVAWQVKSYLAGNPAIRLALNEDLAVGRQEGNAPRWGTGGGDVVMLDDCNFHESVVLDRFETERMLELVPPDGEFALMQYRHALVSVIGPAVIQMLWPSNPATTLSPSY